jgi:hypothetical protein
MKGAALLCDDSISLVVRSKRRSQAAKASTLFSCGTKLKNGGGLAGSASSAGVLFTRDSFNNID